MAAQNPTGQVLIILRRIFFLIVLLLVAGCVFVWVAPAGPRAETLLDIAPGTSSFQIASQLQKRHLIWSRYAFEALRMIKGGTLKAGEYRFDHPARLAEIYYRLRRGDVYTLSLTIPEGANIFDIAQRVEAAGLGSNAAFVKAASADVGLVKDLDPGARSLEGYLFPDTYQFPPIAKPKEMVAAMVKRFRQAGEEAGLLRGGGKADVHRVVTLASLVERETPIEAERPVVASVFVNRLKRGMPLMTDPSVIYAALLDGRYRGAIFQSDLAADSPYNTYKHAGLPPGPICNPGLASIRAVMSPASTNYLYFVAATADPSGRSRFSSTFEEHERNVEAYRHATGGQGSAPEQRVGREAGRSPARPNVRERK